MTNETTYYRKLLQRYIRNCCTPQEMEEVLDYIRENKSSRLLLEQMREEYNNTAHNAEISQEEWSQELRRTLIHHTGKNKTKSRVSMRTWWVAASVLLLAGAGAYFGQQYNNDPQALTNNYKLSPVDIAPGQDGAILILSDGTQVVLDSLGNGAINDQNGTQVLLQDGQLAYTAKNHLASHSTYHTLHTPKGRQFRILLPDGTSVWLNASSSIRYPTIFSGEARKVEVTGEAYFEVAKNSQLPFRVSVANKAEVEVLGTHFNINAYEDENTINTTLLEGSVKVTTFQPTAEGPATHRKQRSSVLLEPGQQAQISVDQQANPEILVIPNADIEKVLAWRNGVFDFQGLSLAEVMRQLVRWYDIEVEYEKGIPNISFFGKMSRDVSLEGLIRTLEKTGVRFKIVEGRRLVVSP
ncbi:MAG TPA: FecR domain-containing protein [Parasegetibacter sp.]|jgi:transmembrane sensor